VDDPEKRRQYFRDRQARRRKELVALFGGKCAKCRAVDNLDFDHIDPGSMSFRLSGWAFNYSWERILKEAAKCQLLCKKCHREKTIKDLYPDTVCTVTGRGYINCPCDGCRVKRNNVYRQAKREWMRKKRARIKESQGHVAQGSECLSDIQVVGGSNPSLPTPQ
jgi:hypothetical protein